MVDTKLSALTELAATPTSDDELYIRDVSEAAANESKRITVSNLMDASVRTATLVVAANDSSAKSKAGADYVCNGTDDDVQIQEAIDALPAGGGKVVLSEGEFSTGGTAITVPSNFELELVKGAKIKLASNTNGSNNIIENDDSTSGNSNIYIHGGEIDGNKTNQTSSGSVIYFDNVTRTTVEGIYIHDNFEEGIVFVDSDYFKVDKVISNDNGSGGVQQGSGIRTGDGCSNFTVSNSFFSGHDGAAIDLGGSGAQTDFIVMNNIATDSSMGILIADGSNIERVSVIGNICFSNKKTAAYGAAYAQIYVAIKGDSIVSSNLVYDSDAQGIRIAGTRMSVLNNTVRDVSSSYGIYQTSGDAIISNNTVYNGVKGIVCSGSGYCYNNSIHTMTEDGIRNPVIAKGNYIYNSVTSGSGTYGAIYCNKAGSELVDNYIDTSGRYGIIGIIDSLSTQVIRGNYITGATLVDCWVRNGSDISILSNQFLSGTGVTVDNVTGLKGRDNVGYTAPGDTVTIFKTIDHADLTDGGDATAYADFADEIPAGSIIKAVRVDYTEAFNSDDTITLTLQIGDDGGSDPDQFNKTASGEDAFNTTTDIYWGESDCQDHVVTSATTVRLLFTEDDDGTDIISSANAQGAVTVTITYMKA